MNLPTFLQQRRPDWKQLEALLRRVEGSGLGTLSELEAVEFGRLYRRTASDLNQARTFVTGDALAQYLNDLVARCYLVIYAKTRVDVWGFLVYLFWGYPAVFRRHARPMLLATVLFAAGTLLGFFASYFDPHTARSYLLPAEFPMIQPGDDSHSRAMTAGELSGFSAFLFTNNMSVSLVAFALGMTFGVGTAWLMFSNGILMGALAAVFLEAGHFLQFCTGILPHGVLEIPAVLIAGGAGFLLAQGMIRAHPWSRLDELARIGKEGLLLVTGCLPLLLAAAALEAGVARAPDWVLSSGLKLATAGVMGTLFVVYVLVFGAKR